jgi:hypothetical protein
MAIWMRSRSARGEGDRTALYGTFLLGVKESALDCGNTDGTITDGSSPGTFDFITAGGGGSDVAVMSKATDFEDMDGADIDVEDG